MARAIANAVFISSLLITSIAQAQDYSQTTIAIGEGVLKLDLTQRVDLIMDSYGRRGRQPYVVAPGLAVPQHLRTSIRRATKRVYRCFSEERGRRPRPAGVLAVHFVIGPNGKPKTLIHRIWGSEGSGGELR